MAPSRWDRLHDLFERATALPPAERPGFLDAECGDDDALRRQLVEMLRHDAVSSGGVDTRILDAVDASTPRMIPRIPGYRLGERIGHGGMGEVWEAEQLEPVRRRVAIKVIRAGLDSDALMDRFERERQALALMAHSSISRVHEVGRTEDGRPYFSMEFIDGPPITTWCDQEGVGLRARLELFARVCAAVDHAHRKTVLHRDLKPSNILVATEDGEPVPKVIDFGVAKALGDSSDLATLHTEAGLLVGTPEYMSPEQARGEASDTRSDVYSLGMVLYELLAGALPYDPQELRSGGVETMLRRLREDELPRPSHRASSRGHTSDEVARARGVGVHGLRNQLSGDLDWIVMKALEKDPDRRYPTPAALADDIAHFLAFEPVEARPPSVGYRFSRFVRRNRVGVGVTALVALFLVGLAVTTSLQARRIAAERDRANHEAETATAHARFMEELFRNVDPDRMRGEEVSALDLLDAGTAQIEAELGDQPELQSRLLYSVGKVYNVLGDYETARRLVEEALRLSEETLGPHHRQTASSASTLANIHNRQGNYARADTLHLRAIAGLTALLGPDHRSTLRARSNRAEMLGDLGRPEEAEALLAEVVEARIRELGPDDKDTLYGIANLAQARHALGRSGEAIAALREILPRIEATIGPDHPNSPFFQHMLAGMLADVGKSEEAAALWRDCVPRLERILGPDHPHTRDARDRWLALAGSP